MNIFECKLDRNAASHLVSRQPKSIVVLSCLPAETLNPGIRSPTESAENDELDISVVGEVYEVLRS